MHLLHMYICIMYLLCHVMYGLSVIKYIYTVKFHYFRPPLGLPKTGPISEVLLLLNIKL